MNFSESPSPPGQGSTRTGKGTFALGSADESCSFFEATEVSGEDPEVDTEVGVCWAAELVPCNLADSALKEENDNWVDLQLVGLVCWYPLGSHSLPGVGLGELHSLMEPGLAVELHSLIELAGELHNFLGVGWVEERLRVGSLLDATGVDSWADSLQMGVEVEQQQQQLEQEVGNWVPPRLVGLCS